MSRRSVLVGQSFSYFFFKSETRAHKKDFNTTWLRFGWTAASINHAMYVFVAKARLSPIITGSYQKLSAVQTANVIYVATDLSTGCEHRQSCVMFAVEKEAG